MPKFQQKPFDQMTRAEKRVAIAKDVILQVIANKYQAISSIYVLTGRVQIYNQQTVKQIKECQCCAVGSAVLSGMRLFNEVEYNPDSDYNRSWISIMTHWFELEQIKWIESAFECWPSIFPSRAKDFKIFFNKYPDPKNRLIAIMRNIIRHKGNFVLPQYSKGLAKLKNFKKAE